MPEWIIPAVMLGIALLSPLLAWWGSTRYFAGMLSAQEEAAAAWRTGAESRLSQIETMLRANSYDAMLVRMARTEKDISDLREWKHVKADPYVGAVDVLKSRVDQLEKRR